MSENNTTSVPLLGDISLEYVQRIEHSLDAGFRGTRIAGLPGELQQNAGRLSHRIDIAGLLFGESAADQLETLQQAASEGAEVTFVADITSAVELQQVVIVSFRAMELAAQPNTYYYELSLVESPPLPPPAQVEPFGGLGDFGVGDLGFDTDILGELDDLAGDIASAVDDALNVMDQLGALANMDGLSLDGGFLEPMDGVVNEASNLGQQLGEALSGLSDAFSS